MGQIYLFAHGASIAPQTEPISPTTFALSYYQLVNDYVLYTTVCEVAFPGLSISMTPPIMYPLFFINLFFIKFC